MELLREYGQPAIMVFPMVDADGDPVSSIGDAAATYTHFTDTPAGGEPGSFASVTASPVEIDSTGVYYLVLNAGEMSHRYLYVKITGTGAKTQHILIRTVDDDPAADYANISAVAAAVIVTYHLDHLLYSPYSPASKPGDSGSLFNTLVENDAGTAFTANALNNAPTGSGATAQQVWEYGTRILTANTNLNDPSAATIADAVWDEASTGHVDAGKAGAQLWTDIDAILVDTGSTLDGKLDVIDGIVDSILVDTGTTLPGTLSTMEGKIDTIDGIVDAILVDTDNTIPGTLSTIAGYIDTEITAIKTVTDQLADTLEDDGGVWRFTENALEEAPSGTGGDATAANQTTIINYLENTDYGLAKLARTGADSDTLETLSDQLDGVGGGDATAANQTTIIGHLTAMKGDGFDEDTDSLEDIKNAIAGVGVGGAVGSGANSWTLTVKDTSENPLDNVAVWISTDAAGENVIAGTLHTNSSGEVTFMLDAGTYYRWCEHAGYTFTNPQTFTVTE